MLLRYIAAFLICFPVNGQSYFSSHFGANIGIALNFGTHVNSVGLSANTYYSDYFFQVNLGSTIKFYGNSIGGRKHFFEVRSSFGAILTNGNGNSRIDYQFDGLNHQTQHDYAIGYNYIIYLDNVGTSQHSGGFSLHIKNLSLYHENDVFAGQTKDRFRTASSFIGYNGEFYKAGIGFKLWTGETSGARWEKQPQPGAKNGFKVLEDLPFGKTSHGIAFTTFNTFIPYGQNVHLKLGVDSEQIRHIIQNRFIHDLVFLPKSFKRTTPHYPRLDKNGCAVFAKKDIKPIKFYMQFGINEVW